MRSWILIICLFVSSVQAKTLLDSEDNQSVGLAVGSVIALTYQVPYRVKNILAFTGAVSGESLRIYSDYFVHLSRLPKFPSIQPYWGAGIGLSTEKESIGSDMAILLRAPLGGKYSIENSDYVIFAQVAPELQTNGHTGIQILLGFNYIF